MRRLFNRDEGFTLAWLSMILFLLLAMAGFGTDLGWIYLNTVRTQNAVDAAALAGVVNLPGFDPAPDAEAAARANGYDPGGNDTLNLTQTADNELYAQLSTSIEPFFMRVLGFTRFDITREATARYIKPVPLGSPSNCFGGGSTSECPSSEDFWAAVSGRHTLLEDGDPYSTLCDDPNDPCDDANTAYARGDLYPGYYYGVDVPTGTTSLEVRIFNGGFDSGGAAGDSNFTGPGGAVNARYRLFRPDTTPLIPQDHIDGTATPVCTDTPGSSATAWDLLCSTISNPTPGIWLVHIETTTDNAGSNNFAIRATGSPTSPRVYGINDMSIWSDDLVGSSELYIAEVGEEHAGKKLELSFYDAGDAFAESWYRVRDPQGNIPQCSWKVYTAPYPDEAAVEVPSLSSSGSQSCQWQTQTAGAPGRRGVYNKLWIVATIDLPDDADDMCNGTGPDACFWKMQLDLSDPVERTTWRARVIGNPVQLVPTPTTTP